MHGIFSLEMAREKEKRSINLSTCRATPSEETRLLELLPKFGYEKPAHLWRQFLTQFLEQNEGDREIEAPPRFVEKEKPGAEKPSGRRVRKKDP